MGPAIGSSNYALPTSRLLNYLKRRAVKDLLSSHESMPPADVMSEEMRKRLPVRGRILKALGLINRVAEEWYRQLVVLVFRLRGYIVVCDRHFLFEYHCDTAASKSTGAPMSVRIHGWLLRNCYPRPGLVMHLYAPPAVLHARTPEWNLEYLAHQQAGIRDQGKAMDGYLEIDATRSLDDVTETAERHIEAFYELRR